MLNEINKALDSDKVTHREKLVPEQYHKFLTLFLKADANSLRSYRSYDNRTNSKKVFEL